MPRIRELPHNEVPEEFSAQLDKVFGAVRDRGTLTGTPGNWWTVWSRVPGILNAFGAYSYTAAPLPAEILELALVRTGYVRASRFVFSQHSKAARRVGVAEDKIAAVPYWSISNVYTEKERAVFAYVDGLMLEDGRVHDKVFALLKVHLSEEEILVLTYFVNMYSLHAVSTKALRLECDDVPERVVEIPAPDMQQIQDWR